jgi:hypothetical protein
MLYVFLTLLVLFFPSNEVKIWFVISVGVFVPAIIIAVLEGNLIERILAFLSFFFIAMLPLGFPGTLIGWSGSFLIGLLSGRIWPYLVDKKKNRITSLFLIAPLFFSVIMYEYTINGISHDVLSNFFQASSINYACSVILGCASLFGTCEIVRNKHFVENRRASQEGLISNVLIIFFLAMSILFILSMDYRSGLLGVIGLVLFIISRIPKASSWVFLLILFYLFISFFDFFINFIVPDRDSPVEIFSELAGENNRISRAVDFGGQVLLDKSDFSSWAEKFSVSALSDLMAVAFPLSIGVFIYLLIYLRNIFKIGSYENLKILRYSLFILTLSGVTITLLQPDFFNLYVFGFQMALINACASSCIRKPYGKLNDMSRFNG